jgi:catabolite regulation protein CreA
VNLPGEGIIAFQRGDRRAAFIEPAKCNRQIADHDWSGFTQGPYSDRVIEGSPKNSISSVPIMAWPEP